jgi:UDP-N-acetylglucosamine--N-acetylmuramyl-(pentapeptide) pyrophosphoryl-undecaprenol N-acetylglucosamine transferase
MIAITGGGTGGHLAIARALKEELNTRGIKPIFIGSANGQDMAWFEHDDGFGEKIFLNSVGVVNKKGIAKIGSFLRVLSNSSICLKLLKDKEIKKVISVGGYSAAPLVFASIITRTALYIHEQNAVMGKLNRMAKPFAKEFFSSFSDISKCKSYPVPKIFFDKARVREKIEKIIFLGGSQGASAINNLAIKIAPVLLSRGIKIIHQTGVKDFERVKHEYTRLAITADIFAFSNDIATKMNGADFAISRAGASALFELTANALPTFFLPYPHAAQNHQEFNAKFLSDRGLAFYSNERELIADELLNIIFSSNIKIISQKLACELSPDGAKCIIDCIAYHQN